MMRPTNWQTDLQPVVKLAADASRNESNPIKFLKRMKQLAVLYDN